MHYPFFSYISLKALEKKEYEPFFGLFLTKEKKSRLLLDNKLYYSFSLFLENEVDNYKALRCSDDITIKNINNRIRLHFSKIMIPENPQTERIKRNIK